MLSFPKIITANTDLCLTFFRADNPDLQKMSVQIKFGQFLYLFHVGGTLGMCIKGHLGVVGL